MADDVTWFRDASTGDYWYSKGGGTPQKYVPAKLPHDPITAAGTGKAVASGLVHGAVPAILGLPGDLEAVGRKVGGPVADWLSKLGKPPDEALEPLKEGVTKGDTTIVAKPTDPWPQGKLPPSEPRAETVFAGARPYSEAFAKYTGFPEYTPRNFLERALKGTAELAPTMALNPEAAATGAMARSVRLLRGGAKYAGIPAFASEGVSEIPGVEGSWAEPYLKFAATAASPGLVGKITPNPHASTAISDMVDLLRGHGVHPTAAQPTLDAKKIRAEAASANMRGSGTNAAAINETQQEQFNNAVLGYVGKGGPKASSATLKKIDDEINAEYNRILGVTGRSSGPYHLATAGGVDAALAKIVKDYEHELGDTAGKGPATQLAAIRNYGAGTGIMDGRQYQARRHELSALSADTNDPNLKIAYAKMRAELDNAMDRAIGASNPADADALKNVRHRFQNQMIVKRATSAAEEDITPQSLLRATESVLGHDETLMSGHPLAQLGKAGTKVLKKLPDVGGDLEHLKEAGILASVLAGGKLAEHPDDTTQPSGLTGAAGYVGGAAASIGLPVVRSWARHNPSLQWILRNQLMPKISERWRPNLVGPSGWDNARNLLLLEALTKGRRREPIELPEATVTSSR